MIDDIVNSNIWNVITSISTLSAIIVSLYLANREKKIIRKLHISQQFSDYYSKGEAYLIVTIENVGNVPIILYSCGRKDDNSNEINQDIQDYLVDKEEYIMIKPNEAKILTYKCFTSIPLNEQSKFMYKQKSYKLLKKAKFRAQDTLGHFYQ